MFGVALVTRVYLFLRVSCVSDLPHSSRRIVTSIETELYFYATVSLLSDSGILIFHFAQWWRPSLSGTPGDDPLEEVVDTDCISFTIDFLPLFTFVTFELLCVS